MLFREIIALLKNSILSDITLCGPLKVTRGFTGTYRLHLQSKTRYLLSASCWFLSWNTLAPWRWRRHVPPKRRLTFNGLHGVISQQTELSPYDDGLGLDYRGSIPGRDKRCFLYSYNPDRLWGSPSLLTNRYRASYRGCEAAGAWSWPLTSMQCLGQQCWSYISIPTRVLMAWCLIN
jgi:hypothetical protein